jgi:GNAT superfamily N-acetyltransferase
MASVSNVLLIECRMALRLTQQELGDLVGCTKRTIQRWEDRGALFTQQEGEALAGALRMVRPDLAAQIAAIVGISLAKVESPAIRPALVSDLRAVVALFAIPGDGNERDQNPGDPIDPRYSEAFATIASDPNNVLLVAEMCGRVVGAFQLTVVQYVARRGGRVAWIESVIVDPAMRRRGVGAAMIRWAIEEARRRGCFRVQLTSGKALREAHAFYESLGFVASHEGMKLTL